MSEASAGDRRFEDKCLEALKALSKAMLQLSLYEASHPSVSEKLTEGAGLISEAAEAGGRGALTFAKDQDRWLANGRIIGSTGREGGPVAALIARFKLNSITSSPGLTVPELTAFCELAAARPDAVPDFAAFLRERGVERIRFNEAVYAKVDERFRGVGLGAGAGEGRGAGEGGAAAAGAGDGAGDGDGAGPGAGAEAGAGAGGAGAGEGAGPGASGEADGGAAIRRSLEGRSIESSLQILIQKVARDPEEQRRIYELIMEQLRHEIEQKVLAATKTLRSEQTLVRSEQVRTESVMQNAGEGIIVVDGKGNIMLMNPAAEEIYGARLADIAGQPVAAGAGDTRVVALASDLEGSPDKPPSASIQVSGADGVKRTIGASWAVVQNEGGRVVGMVMTLTDLAKHRRLEQAERDFVAHVAHELRSPLSSIQASLDILESEIGGSLDESQKRVMANSLFNTQRLAGLINDILDFSKIESGMMTVRPRRSDARKAASDAVESLGPWAARKQLTLTLSAAPDLPDAQLDPRRTVQVLVNLLSNAIKFTPAGGAVVVGVGRSRTEPDRWLVFGVSDTGPGIPKREQERIFQRFLQLGQGEKHAGAGTGLGLTISKALVEMQGGQLWFESEEGRGTRFYFTLPVFVPEPEGEATPPPPPPPAPWWKRLFGLG